MTEKRQARIFIQSLALIAFLAAGIFARSAVPAVLSAPDAKPSVAAAATVAAVKSAPAAGPASDSDLKRSARVIHVVDGDTIDVIFDGATSTVKTRVRLIGIDTPEIVDPRKLVQCFAKEASAETKKLLDGQPVVIETDPSQGPEDRYGRLLGYVFAADGTDINQLLIEEGYAREYTYRLPYEYQEEFKAAEKQAKAAGKGLWAAASCDGQK